MMKNWLRIFVVGVWRKNSGRFYSRWCARELVECMVSEDVWSGTTSQTDTNNFALCPKLKHISPALYVFSATNPTPFLFTPFQKFPAPYAVPEIPCPSALSFSPKTQPLRTVPLLNNSNDISDQKSAHMGPPSGQRFAYGLIWRVMKL